MKLLRRGGSDESDNEDLGVSESVAAPQSEGGKGTTGKGRPTPKRREAEARRRGPVAPAPLTAKEARARRKAAKQSLSKDERKARAAERRAAAGERRTRMLAGEEKYLLPRDKGPVRAYVRDLVDSRRNLVGLFMPMALILIMTMFLGPVVQQYVTLAMFAMIVLMVIEGIYLGRLVNKKVRARFPDTTEGGFGLGWYAFVRASQIRKLRAPLPRVSPGDAV
ncbi:membrane protein [Rhodococcus ruber Chol-4]|uniref:Uncharacterized protein n=1 Tax=Rhodococcus ruber TaxID=1830 RepID=A0A098BV69_9NOCA|nr:MULTISPECIES: DUF3043 domain-containing protein [Rhodococcus]MDO2381046.1 DUF3043 domain-containing protein [Rhodococcus ruber]NGR06023.1 DUF3043 domain-containing protein [bacterium SGD-2]RIK10555.1 MAG: DUF3043 domain-containing protein [Acidobacteriota bacterium]ATQ28187.1 DUF3043 domain-containing protein [Rhodococcus ruber]AUM17137.1 DUF3043 domain-containing protein [Rhodococcus ruber]